MAFANPIAVMIVVLGQYDRTCRGIGGVWTNGDLDSLAKGSQKPKEAVNAVAFHATTHQGGHFRLVEPQVSALLTFARFNHRDTEAQRRAKKK